MYTVLFSVMVASMTSGLMSSTAAAIVMVASCGVRNRCSTSWLWSSCSPRMFLIRTSTGTICERRRDDGVDLRRRHRHVELADAEDRVAAAEDRRPVDVAHGAGRGRRDVAGD